MILLLYSLLSLSSQCGIEFTEEPNWLKRMGATRSGLNFLSRHMLVNCPSNDSLVNSARQIEHADLQDFEGQIKDANAKEICGKIKLLERIAIVDNSLTISSGPTFFEILMGVKLVGDQEALILESNFVHMPITPETASKWSASTWGQLEEFYLKTPINEHSSRWHMATDYVSFMEKYRRLVMILFLHIEEGSEVQEMVRKPFFEGLKLGMGRVRVIHLLEESEEKLNKYLNSPAESSITEEEWKKQEMAEATKALDDEAFVTALFGDPSSDNIWNKVLKIRQALMICLGEAACARSTSLILLQQAELIADAQMIKLWPSVVVRNKTLARWFEDRVVKYVGELLPREEKSDSVNMVQMVLNSLKNLKPIGDFLGDWQKRVENLSVLLMQYAWSSEYPWLCANKILIENMSIGSQALLRPSCVNHAMAVVVDRRGADEYLYFMLNSGAGLEHHHRQITDPDGKPWFLPVAAYRVNREILANQMSWSSRYSLIGVNDQSIYPPAAAKIPLVYEGQVSLYTKGQATGTCLAKSVRLAIQFLMGEPFYRLLKSQIALDWLPALLEKIANTLLTSWDNVKVFRSRWGLPTSSKSIAVRDVLAINTILSLLERHSNGPPPWIRNMDEAIRKNVDKLIVKVRKMKISFSDIIKAWDERHPKAYLSVNEQTPIESWCQLKPYHPFLLGYQPFVKQTLPAEERRPELCGRRRASSGT